MDIHNKIMLLKLRDAFFVGLSVTGTLLALIAFGTMVAWIITVASQHGPLGTASSIAVCAGILAAIFEFIIS